MPAGFSGRSTVWTELELVSNNLGGAEAAAFAPHIIPILRFCNTPA
jgi:hypothetical protein